jgi:hypothetical protein
VVNNLISFYLNEGRDSEGRTLAEIWAMSDDELMHTHDVVQWLFPLTDPSNFNPDAPILTEKEIDLFRADSRLQKNLLASFHRFMQVFGLAFEHGEIRQVADKDIWMHLNHNWLRFTRILKSLTILGLKDEAMAFFRFLERKIGNVDSMAYWRTAVGLGPNSV